MQETVLVLGAGGRFGRAATTAFAAAGWRVRTLSRGAVTVGDPAIDARRGDARDPAVLASAMTGVDVVVYAINPPYGRWSRDVLPLAERAFEAAELVGATVLLPGNVYAYGDALPARLDESTPFAPSETLGRVRERLERRLREASERGARAIVLRAGDFVEGRRSGNWFEDHVLGRLDAGRVRYPGPLDRAHAWAWLDDVAAAAVGLAATRHRLAPFETVGFPGWSPTGQELVATLERVSGHSLTVGAMPWPLIRLAAPFSADLRGVLSVRWLWERPHAIDGRRLAELLPDFRPLDLDAGLALALTRLGRDVRSSAEAIGTTQRV